MGDGFMQHALKPYKHSLTKIQVPSNATIYQKAQSKLRIIYDFKAKFQCQVSG
jgi:hypothetical protein